MSKYQEALDFFVLGRSFKECEAESTRNYWRELQELVDKETPMKPNGNRCGRCGMTVKIWAYEDMEIKLNRCRGKHCGQVVDWIDEY